MLKISREKKETHSMNSQKFFSVYSPPLLRSVLGDGKESNFNEPLLITGRVVNF